MYEYLQYVSLLNTYSPWCLKLRGLCRQYQYRSYDIDESMTLRRRIQITIGNRRKWIIIIII